MAGAPRESGRRGNWAGYDVWKKEKLKNNKKLPITNTHTYKGLYSC